MTDPIGNRPHIDRAPPGTTAGKKPAETGANPTGAQAASTGANVGDASMHSNRLQAVRAAIDATPAMDLDRVAAIRDQVARGDYPLDPDRIAERFAEFEQLLHG